MRTRRRAHFDAISGSWVFAAPGISLGKLYEDSGGCDPTDLPLGFRVYRVRAGTFHSSTG